MQGVVIALSFVLPWLGTVAVTPLVNTSGLHKTVAYILQSRMAVAVLGLISVVFGMCRFQFFFLLTNRVLCECVCRLVPLINSDFVDEDSVLHKREGSHSGSIVGGVAFVGKIGQSLAPMLGFTLFASYVEDAAPEADIFVCLVAQIEPIIVVLLQLALWSRIALHRSDSAKTKTSLSA